MKIIRIITIGMIIFAILTCGCSQGRNIAAATPSPTPPETTETSGTKTLQTTLLTPAVVESPPESLREITAQPTTAIPQISENKLNAVIRSCKNNLSIWRMSSVSEYQITVNYIQLSQGTQKIIQKTLPCHRELGYIVDVNTGKIELIKGSCGYIDMDYATLDIDKSHEFIFLHTHPDFWTDEFGTIETFSPEDLYTMGNLTTKGYRFQKMIAISANSEYEIYPNIPFAWQLKGSIDNTTRRIEKEMDVRFYTYSPVYDYEFVNVQNLMPLLAPRLNYTYKIDNAVIR